MVGVRAKERAGRVRQALPAERHHTILDVVRNRRAVRVSTLSELLGVSEVTVRRDLEDLEHRGLLERTHGGAIATQRMGPEPAYIEASGRNAGEKRAIGRVAASLTEPGDTVFLNGGTTTLQVFRHLDPGVRVVTNHVGMALEAADRDVELLLVGGDYRAPSNSCVGTFACDMLRRVFATKAFIGVEGVGRRSGLTSPRGRGGGDRALDDRADPWRGHRGRRPHQARNGGRLRRGAAQDLSAAWSPTRGSTTATATTFASMGLEVVVAARTGWRAVSWRVSSPDSRSSF